MRLRAWVGRAALALVLGGCGSDESASGAGTADSGPVDGGSDVLEEGGDAAPDGLASFTLTVVNGYGSGTYAPGETVHVWAAVRPWTELVTGWSGDVDVLALPKEWHTTLVMPSRDVKVEADVDVREEVFDKSTFKGTTQTDKTVIRYIPDAPRGLVLMLHGTSGSAQMIEKPEARYVALSLIARGYGVLATEAEEVAAGDLNNDDNIRWDPALVSGNVDFANLNTLIDELRQQGVVEADVPLYVMGMSNGGAMSVSLGAIADAVVASEYPNLRFAAAVSYCASGRAGAAQISTTPTGWMLCANDDNEQVSNDDAVANGAALETRGIPTFVDAHPASPLYDERFTRVPGVDAAASAAVAEELREKLFVDGDGTFVVPTADILQQVQADPSEFPAVAALPGSALSSVVDQVRVMQAEHQMYSDWASRTVDFFDAHGPSR